MLNRIGFGLLALIALWLIATLSLGGVAAPYERMHLLLVSAVATIGFFLAWREGSWRGCTPCPAVRWALVGSVFFILLPLLQVIPFPQGILQAFASFTMEMTYGTLAALQIRKEPWYPISLDPQATALALEQVLGFFLVLATALAIFAKPEHRKRLALSISVATAAIAFFGMVHRFSGSTKMFWILERGWTFFGPYVSANHAGALFATAGALTLGLLASRQLSRTDRAGLYFVLGVIVLGLLFTGSRAAVLGLAVATTAHFLTTPFRKHVSNRISLTVLGVAFGTALAWKASFLPRIVATPENMAIGHEFRLNYWGYPLELWLKAPGFGIGFGAFSRLSPAMAGDSVFLHAEHAENDFLELLCCGGSVGFLLAMIPLFFLVRRIVSTLRSQDATTTSKGFALALVAFLTDSFFVFNAPLPAHQILFALLLAGFLGSHRFSVLSDRWVSSALSIALMVSFSLGSLRLVRSSAFPPASASASDSAYDIDVGDSPANRRAAFLTMANEAEVAILKDPLDDRAVYAFAEASAALAEMDRAKTALDIAVRLNPFDYFHRIRVAQRLGNHDPAFTLDLIEKLLGGGAPLGPGIRLGLRLEAAMNALRLEKNAVAREQLEHVEAISDDWRVPLIRMLMTEDPVPLVRESWKRAQTGGVKNAVWDAWLLQILRLRKFPVDLSSLASLKWNRSDLGEFLAKLVSLEPGREKPLAVRLDPDTGADFLRPNTPESAVNSRIAGRVLDVHVIRNQMSIDAYLLPTILLLSPPDLSVRMVVDSRRDIKTQLMVEIDGQLFLTKEPARRLPTGLWELTFSNLGQAIPAQKPEEPRTITGIGFTPLEKNGRYIIEAIEIFVDSVR